MEFYFHAITNRGLSARIVLPSITRCEEIKEALRYKDVRCGITNTVTVHFHRTKEEEDIAVQIIGLVL